MAFAEPGAWRPLGEAFRAHLAGESVTLIIESDDGVERPVPIEAFLRDDGPLPEIEEFALSLCRSPVLDVGAGSGPHAARLEEMGHRVVAIDLLPEAVEAMRRRGLADARCVDFDRFADEATERFRTILLLMNGIGVVGTLEAFPDFLRSAAALLEKDGQLIFDSTDVRRVDDDAVRASVARRLAAGEEAGEVTYRLRVGETVGEAYPWLYLDADSLTTIAAREGWATQILFEDDEGQYLARLRPL